MSDNIEEKEPLHYPKERVLPPELKEFLFDAQRDARELRERYIGKLVEGEMTLEEFMQLAKSSHHESLARTKLSTILRNVPGWNVDIARHALIGCGIPANSQVLKLFNRPDIVQQFSNMMAMSPQRWARRYKAPVGWPWKGSIVSVLKDLDVGSMPRELQRLVMWECGDDQAFHMSADEMDAASREDSEMAEFYQARGRFIPDDMAGDDDSYGIDDEPAPDPDIKPELDLEPEPEPEPEPDSTSRGASQPAREPRLTQTDIDAPTPSSTPDTRPQEPSSSGDARQRVKPKKVVRVVRRKIVLPEEKDIRDQVFGDG